MIIIIVVVVVVENDDDEKQVVVVGEERFYSLPAPNFRVDFLKCWSKMPSGTLKTTQTKGEKWWTNERSSRGVNTTICLAHIIKQTIHSKKMWVHFEKKISHYFTKRECLIYSKHVCKYFVCF